MSRVDSCLLHRAIARALVLAAALARSPDDPPRTQLLVIAVTPPSSPGAEVLWESSAGGAASGCSPAEACSLACGAGSSVEPPHALAELLPMAPVEAVRVGSVRRVVCASPRYLAERGVPWTPAELSRFEALTFSSTASPQAWSFASGTRVQTVSPPTQMLVNTAEVAIAAAVAGRGVTRVFSYQIAPELLSGKLQIVLVDFEPPPIPIHVVYLEGRRAHARVRSFVDFAVDRLRSEKSLNG